MIVSWITQQQVVSLDDQMFSSNFSNYNRTDIHEN